MKVVGLITEYNPFHNGHKYHIDEAKRITGADYAIAVMSGNFVQRGAPAVIDKYSRAAMALSNGVDLVLEIPVCYATGSAEYFAHGAVSLLHKLGIVDYLCFGSECGDISLLSEATAFLNDTPEVFDERLQDFLKEGLTYPAARLKALKSTLESSDTVNGKALSKVLTEPNNILGIEYIKAIQRLSSPFLPVTIQRIAAHYHSSELSEQKTEGESMSLLPDALSDTEKATVPKPNISSATAVRRVINNISRHNSDSLEVIKQHIPESVFDILVKNYEKTYPITEEDFSAIIKYKLLTEDSKALSSYMDINPDLADRLKNISDYNCSMSELTAKIKTKNMTLTRINRALIHLLLNIKQLSFDEYKQGGYVRYARVLGVRKEATKLLRKIEKEGTLPLITKVSKAVPQLDTLGQRMLAEDLWAAHIYNQAVYEKYKTAVLNEYKRGIIIL